MCCLTEIERDNEGRLRRHETKITKSGTWCFQAFGVSKKFLCLNVPTCEGRVPHFVYAYVEPISIGNMLMKFNLN